jgi:hypothetical protein
VTPWFHHVGAPTSAVVPRDWSTGLSWLVARTTSTGASQATHGSAATLRTTRGDDASSNASTTL